MIIDCGGGFLIGWMFGVFDIRFFVVICLFFVFFLIWVVFVCIFVVFFFVLVFEFSSKFFRLMGCGEVWNVFLGFMFLILIGSEDFIIVFKIVCVGFFL